MSKNGLCRNRLKITFGSGHPKELWTAWSLIDDDFHKIQLPSTTKSVSARNNQVGIVTKSNEILLWNVGGALTSIDLPPLLREWCPEAIVFHPLKKGCCFVYYIDLPGNMVRVGEFLDGEYCSAQYVS